MFVDLGAELAGFITEMANCTICSGMPNTCNIYWRHLLGSSVNLQQVMPLFLLFYVQLYKTITIDQMPNTGSTTSNCSK